MIPIRRPKLSVFGWIFVLALAATHFTSAPVFAQVGADDLEQMLGPIALYSDELLANVLAASMYPDEIAAAGKYVAGGGDTAKIGEQGWEESVMTVARIPELIKMMSNDLDWTRAVGEAYVVQPQDVMTAIQILRSRAKSNGSLASNEYQTVTTEGSNIIIQPAQSDVVYVPQYSTQVVYVESGPSGGEVAAGMAMMFGTAIMMGAIYNNSMCCYWGGGGYVGWGHPPYYGGYGGSFNNNDIDINVDNDINIDNDRIKTDNSRGRDGQRLEPNNKKVDTNALRSGKTKSLNNYKGSGQRAKSGQGGGPRIPGGTRPSAGQQDRPGAGGAGQQGQRPSAGTRDAQRPEASTRDAAQRPSAGTGDAAQRPSASTRDAAQRPGDNRASATPAAGSRDASRPSAPKASAGSVSNSSAFRPSAGDAKASSRGHASRSSSASRGSSSRSGGGGGSRGGGGGRGR